MLSGSLCALTFLPLVLVLRFCSGQPELQGANRLSLAQVTEQKDEAQPNWPFTYNKLIDFGGESLRTLVVGDRKSTRLNSSHT